MTKLKSLYVMTTFNHKLYHYLRQRVILKLRGVSSQKLLYQSTVAYAKFVKGGGLPVETQSLSAVTGSTKKGPGATKKRESLLKIHLAIIIKKKNS